MPASIRITGSRPEPRRPDELRRARREAERQLEWAETYLAAAEGVDTGDPAFAREARRLRAEIGRLREGLGRPRLL